MSYNSNPLDLSTMGNTTDTGFQFSNAFQDNGITEYTNPFEGTIDFIDSGVPGQDLSMSTGNGEGMFSNFFSNDEGGQGWGAPAIGAATGIAQTYLGFQQLSEGKKQNKVAQNQWQQQFDLQKSEYDRRSNERAQRIANASAVKAKAGI